MECNEIDKILAYKGLWFIEVRASSTTLHEVLLILVCFIIQKTPHLKYIRSNLEFKKEKYFEIFERLLRE